MTDRLEKAVTVIILTNRQKYMVRHPLPQVPHALWKKYVLHLAEFAQPTSKNICWMPGCSTNSARLCVFYAKSTYVSKKTKTGSNCIMKFKWRTDKV